MNLKTIEEVLNILEKEYKKYKDPIVTRVAQGTRDPFKILVSTILSLRTKDAVTEEASKRLFKTVKTPEDLLNTEEANLEKLIYPVGFYKTKAKRLREIARILIERYNNTVPEDLDELLKLPGVGRKTANLVITLAYNKLGICVDTHVHRISNRLGFVKTKDPHETEFRLRKKLPEKWWIQYNDILVTWGQNICTPVSPKCMECVISSYCEKVGVKNVR